MPTPDQRNYYYTLEAERTGVHRPLLAALYAVQQRPNLLDDDTGLGISPANRIAPNQVNTFPQQVQFAANTLRSLLAALPSQGWGASDLWNAEQGRYTDKFLQQVALGYTPAATDTSAALLESSNYSQLLAAYNQSVGQELIQDASQDLSPFVVTPNLSLTAAPTLVQGAKAALAAPPAHRNLSYLDPALLTLIGRIPEFYQGLDYQRQALLEGVRVWRRLDTIPQAITSLVPNADPNNPDETQLFNQIRAFLQRVLTAYGGFPQEREALIRLTQLWRELPSREQAIASLQTNTSPEPSLRTIDPALINFTYNIPKFFVSLAPQRNALIECVRLWRQLETRADAVKSLGIDPNVLNASAGNNTALASLAAQLDRQLVAFTQRIPKVYKQQTNEREAMIRLVQLWRNLPTRAQTLQSLVNDLKQIKNQKPSPPPVIITPPNRPPKWTLNNIQQSASIIVDGSFTWAEATRGGSRMPPDQETLEGMIRIARLGQRARDRVGRPFIVTSWYRDPVVNAAVGGVSNSRHINGDAIDFYCDGLTGDEIYWILDPWWPSGLGRYIKFPFLCHIDARDYRARWQN